jgi:hypothetical protein
MQAVDWLLNLAGLVLWLKWSAGGAGSRPAPGAYGGAFRRASAPRFRRWANLGLVLILLLARSWLYWALGAEVNWVPRIDLGAVTLDFNSAALPRMVLYSFGSLGVWLALLYLSLLLLSVVNRSVPDTDPVQRAVRSLLGWLERWPWPLKLLLPGLLAALLWWAVHPGLASWGLVSSATSAAHRWQQGAVVAVGAYLGWKYPLCALLGLHLLASYVYLGASSWWRFVQVTGSNLLRPFAWLPIRLGRVDLAPLVFAVLIWWGAAWAERGLVELFGRLPFVASQTFTRILA